MRPWFILLAVSLALSTLFNAAEAWEQVDPQAFGAMFPYLNRTAVKKLTIRVNHQKTLRQSQRVLNFWIDANWIRRFPRQVFEDLRDKEFARGQALSFISHRWNHVKKYIRYLFREAINDGRYSRSEVSLMRYLFWQADRECLNYLQCTIQLFVKKTKKYLDLMSEFIKTHSRIFRSMVPLEDLQFELNKKDGQMPRGNSSIKGFDDVFL